MDSGEVLNWMQTIILAVTLAAAVWSYRVSRADRKADADERERERRRRVAIEDLDRVAIRVLELGETAVTAQNKPGEMDRFLAAKRNLRSALNLYAGSTLMTVEDLVKPDVNPQMAEKEIDRALPEIREELNESQ
jgi:type II secretory pathway pseudopilin PulG